MLGAAALVYVNAYAQDDGHPPKKQVCVRNYIVTTESGSFDPCMRNMGRYTYVIDNTFDASRELVCTMTYDDQYCKTNKQEFDHVVNPDGGVICVINYHQPPISAMCASSPGMYTWVTGAYPD
jgi:hypothetical protein